VLVGANVGDAAAYPPFRGAVLDTHRAGKSPSRVPSAEGPFVRLRLAFRAGADVTEPLLSFGAPESGSVLTARRVEGERVRFALQRRGPVRVQSDLVPIESGRAHELVIRFESTDSPKRRRMLLWLDAQLVFAPVLPWDEGATSNVAVGQDAIGIADCARTFGGTLFSEQTDRQGRDPLQGRGPLRLRTRLPTNRAGQREPLVVTGLTGQGDILLIEYMDAQTVRFGWDHWGAPLVVSEAVPVDFAAEHRIDVAMESLQTVADAALSRELRSGHISVAIDGRRVWEHAGLFFPAEAEEVSVGRNPIGGTVCGPVFGGEILAAERVPRE
jgi:hypothetical protein